MVKKTLGILTVVGMLAVTGVVCYFTFYTPADQTHQSNQTDDVSGVQYSMFPQNSLVTDNVSELKILPQHLKDNIKEVVITGLVYNFCLWKNVVSFLMSLVKFYNYLLTNVL